MEMEFEIMNLNSSILYYIENRFQISPHLPLQKGGVTSPFEKGGLRGIFPANGWIRGWPIDHE